MRFYAPDHSDKRVIFAEKFLEENGISKVNNEKNADFILLGVNPKAEHLGFSKPIFAGNVSGQHIYDYTKDEGFALENAFLTAESALALIISSSSFSIINSEILITGYGRIAKALCFYLNSFTNNLTICARKASDRADAGLHLYNSINFDEICNKNYNIIINTVNFPVINEKELKNINNDTIIIELASFPGGVDVNAARVLGKKLIIARGLPSQYSPETAGEAVGKTVFKMIKEVCF